MLSRGRKTNLAPKNNGFDRVCDVCAYCFCVNARACCNIQVFKETAVMLLACSIESEAVVVHNTDKCMILKY